MAEPQLIKTLTTKRKAIEQAIKSYEKQIELCRRDLAHINATLVVFACPSPDLVHLLPNAENV